MFFRSLSLLSFILLLTCTLFAQKKDPKPLPPPPPEQKIVTGTVLLAQKQAPDAKALVAALKNDWKLKVDSVNAADKTIIFSIPGATAMIAYLDYPIAPAEIKAAADISWLWRTAAGDAGKQQAQVVISLIGTSNKTLELYQAFTAIAAGVLETNGGLGVYMNTQYLLLSKDFYVSAARNMKTNKSLPLYCWVYFGMAEDNGLNSGYTLGMQEFGLAELEITKSKHSAQEVHGVLYDVALQVLRYNTKLIEGQMLTTAEEVKVTARKGKSSYWDGPVMRLEY